MTALKRTQASVNMERAVAGNGPPNLGPRKVLVTGASLFVGRSLIHRLIDQECQVAGLCRSAQPELESLGVEMKYVDLGNASSAREVCSGMDTVFHTAAKVGVWGSIADFRRANVEGTQAIINGCRDFEVSKLVYTSTPSVVFNGQSLSGADESLPYGSDIPCPYPATKAIAEKAVLMAHSQPSGYLKTVALRPHLIWGPGDANLIPRVIDRARKGRLRIVGDGSNRVDLTYIDNVVDAHLWAEASLDNTTNNPGGKAYFISNDEPVSLWQWINELLESQGIPHIEKKMDFQRAMRIGLLIETVWKILNLRSEPPMTRFVASELAKDHWFNISAAKRDLAYQPRVSMKAGMEAFLRHDKGLMGSKFS
ncbi:MAG: NAD-dependent epimerase/dehydratase family protein [Opitutales bacterium]|nr:NAD-dependent epimerase/dehydratase family protein [Opitutales bacterium]